MLQISSDSEWLAACTEVLLAIWTGTCILRISRCFVYFVLSEVLFVGTILTESSEGKQVTIFFAKKTFIEQHNQKASLTIVARSISPVLPVDPRNKWQNLEWLLGSGNHAVRALLPRPYVYPPQRIDITSPLTSFLYLNLIFFGASMQYHQTFAPIASTCIIICTFRIQTILPRLKHCWSSSQWQGRSLS